MKGLTVLILQYYQYYTVHVINSFLVCVQLYEAYEDDNGGSIIAFTVPKDLADGYINNKKEVYKFRLEL